MEGKWLLSEILEPPGDGEWELLLGAGGHSPGPTRAR